MGTNKEWIKKTIAHQDAKRVPYNFSFSPVARVKVEEFYGTKDIEEKFNFPIRMISPKSIKPLYASSAIYGKEIQDEFGVVWNTSDIDRGSPIKTCLKEPSLKNYVFPDPGDTKRFEEIKVWCDKNKDNFTVIWIGDLWERATFMRGMEELLIDTKFDPEFVSQLLEGIKNYILKTMEILFNNFSFDCIALSDDYGNQKQLVMSPKDWRHFIKPILKEIYSFAHKYNCITFHHSCGNVKEIIGDLIGIGLDILHPIQPEAMDIFELKKEFGKDLSFCGGIRTQDLLIRATPEEICEEIKKLKEQMGKGGGYILEPGITIQADVPSENIVAMIEESKR